jgi:hypothetical protein
MNYLDWDLRPLFRPDQRVMVYNTTTDLADVDIIDYIERMYNTPTSLCILPPASISPMVRYMHCAMEFYHVWRYLKSDTDTGILPKELVYIILQCISMDMYNERDPHRRYFDDYDDKGYHHTNSCASLDIRTLWDWHRPKAVDSVVLPPVTAKPPSSPDPVGIRLAKVSCPKKSYKMHRKGHRR